MAKSAVCGFLLLAIALVFGQTLRHDFVNLDDDRYVYENSHVVGGVTRDSIVWCLTHSHEHNWHPLTSISHMLDCGWFGLDAGKHHLVNVIVHAVTAVCLFLVLAEMTGRFWPSAVVAVVFAIHPLRVESVAWVAERKDVLCGLFFMLTLGAYLGYVRRPRSMARYLAVVVLFALGLMTKPMLVTLPFVLLLLDYWPLGRLARGGPDCRTNENGSSLSGASTPAARQSPREPGCEGIAALPAWRLLVEKVPLLLLTGASCVATVLAQHKAISDNEMVPWWPRIANALVALVAYVGQFFYPADLAVLYPHPGSDLPVLKIVGAGTILALIFAGVLAFRRRWPWLPFGWLWYVGTLAPVIGLVQVGSQAMADRYTYLPQIGLTIAIVWTIAHLARSLSWRAWPLAVASAMVVAVLTSCAWRQTAYWRNSETLWLHTLACTDGNLMAHLNYGTYLQTNGRATEAIDQYEKAIAIAPNFAEAYNNLGAAMLAQRRLDAALKYFQLAAQYDPEGEVAEDNLGMALLGKGRAQEAIAHFEKSVQLRPEYLRAHNNLGTALQELGRLDEAIAEFRKAVEIDPRGAESRNNLGNALFSKGSIDEAIDQYAKAVELKPDLVVAQSNLGLAFRKKGETDKAVACYEKVLSLAPDHAEAHNGLGLILHDRGKLNEAIDHYQKAVRAKPRYVEAIGNLATALSQMGRLEEALPHWQEALQIAPNDFMLHNNLANALTSRRRFDEAIVHYRRALEIRPDLVDTQYNLAVALAVDGRLDEAAALLRKVLEVKPDHAKARRNLRNILQMQGKPIDGFLQ